MKALVVVATLLASVNLANLAGAVYADFASRRLDRPDLPKTLAAARVAAKLTPWSSRHAALQGWILAENRQSDAAQMAYETALRLAPGDALLWSEYSLALARLGQFDAPLTLAVTLARELAPSSGAVRQATASLGLSYWSRGTAEQQSLWLASMRDELDRNRATFLGYALTRGQGMAFCNGPARDLGEAAWCESIAASLIDGCFQLTAVHPTPCDPNP